MFNSASTVLSSKAIRRRGPTVRLLVVVAACCHIMSAQGALTAGGARKSRPVQADNGGEFICGYYQAMVARQSKSTDPCDQKKLRDFVWHHWSNRRRGFVKTTYAGIDAGVTYLLKIKPVKGHWQLLVWSQQWSALPGAPRFRRRFLGSSVPTRRNSGRADNWSIVLKTKGTNTTVLAIPHGPLD
jgi:hypothetical protein